MRTELDVVNSCLALMGQAPLPDLTRPSRQVRIAVDHLKKVNRNLQLSGWWFNTQLLTLTPDPTTYSVASQLPTNLLELRGRDKPLTLRDPGVLYDKDGEVVKVRTKVDVIYEVPFRSLPPLAQNVVEELTVAAFAARPVGDRQAADDAQSAAARASLLLNAEHIRQVGANLLDRAEIQHNLFFARGNRPYLRYRS